MGFGGFGAALLFRIGPVAWAAVVLVALVVLAVLSATRGYQSVIARRKYDWLGLIIGAAGITVVIYGWSPAKAS
jgi:uncharacterized membrane protein